MFTYTRTDPNRPGIVPRCSSRLALCSFKGTRSLLRLADNLEYEYALRYEDNLKYEEALKYEDNFKYEDDLKYGYVRTKSI